MNQIINFDNSATSYPKPPGVRLAVSEAVAKYGGNPGRIRSSGKGRKAAPGAGEDSGRAEALRGRVDAGHSIPDAADNQVQDI